MKKHSHPLHTRPERSGPVSRSRRFAVFLCVFLVAAFFSLPFGAVSALSITANPPSPDAMDPYEDLGINLSSTSAIAIETGRGNELYSSMPADQVHIPAVSKIMTALLALERYPSATMVTISSAAGEVNEAAARENRIDMFAAGSKYSIEFLITAMMYMDSDGAAIALAEQVSGEESSFVALMNDRAAQLKMTSSLFVNSTGRAVTSDPETDEGNPLEPVYPQTTPRDAVTLVRYFLKNENYASIVNKAFKTSSTLFFFADANGTRGIELANNLAHAWTFVDTLTGVFNSGDGTGSSLIATFAAGGFETLVILANGSPEEKIRDLQMISQRIYANYTNTVLVAAGQAVPETIKDTVNGKVFGLVYKRTVYYVHRLGETSAIDRKYASAGPHSLPLMADDTVGSMTFSFSNGTSISVECAPDRTIYSVDSSLMDKLLTTFEANRDISVLIIICSGLLGVTMLYQLGAAVTRLFWHIRLRRAEKSAGLSRRRTPIPPDAGGEHKV